jgi:1-deoxy-D-xylulose-5-phosphate synthase
MQNLPVLISVDRAGLNGEDGETHQGLLDMAWGRCVPGLTVCAPRDRADLDFMMSGWLERGIPMMIRYPKGTAPESVPRSGRIPAPWGAAEVLRRGSDICLIGVGATTPVMLEAADGCAEMGAPSPTVVDTRFVSPVDWETLDWVMTTHSAVITAEDGYAAGGLGEAIAARAASFKYPCAVRVIGVGPGYIPHATRAEQLREHGLTPEGVLTVIGSVYVGFGKAASG